MKISVIKVGGKILDAPESLHSFLRKVSKVKRPMVLVHGGGVIATELGEKMGIPTTMIEGRRVTDKDSLDLITMVYGGLINKKLVAGLQAFGINALGLTGADLNVIRSVKRPAEPLDYGYVGDIEKINAKVLNRLLKDDTVPVLAPVTHDQKGQLLNTNADTIAAEVAIRLGKKHKVRLTYCLEQAGVMENNKAIDILSKERLTGLIKNGTVSDGMIPKLETGFRALNKGVKSVRIVSADKLNDVEGGTYLLK